MEPLAKFQECLRTLFQFDLADLDFGIYRILNYKRQQVEDFIANRLPQIVDRAFASYTEADTAMLEQELDNLRRRIKENGRALGQDPFDDEGHLKEAFCGGDLGRKYLELRDKLQSLQLAEDLKVRVYNDLFTFFSRYYEDGDFVSKRRYGRNETYVIPYNGEEVLLYWANCDQYYVKTGEQFKAYRFRVGDFTVVFTLCEASIEQNNNKSKKRYFVLAKEDPLAWQPEAKTLTIFFEYRELDAQEEQKFGRTEQQKPQDKLNEDAVRLIMGQVPEPGLKAWLAAPAENGQTTLAKRLAHFSRRNTSDFFIHKDLRGFLLRELDFFIKNEVLLLDELIGVRGATLERHVQRACVVKDIAVKIIDFLAQVEDFQKRLFEKKKFIVRTDYCLTVDRLPEELWDEVLRNEAQVAEWRELYTLDELPEGDGNNGLDKEFLRHHPELVVDTRYFSEDFKWRLMARVKDLDAALDGVLVRSENFQALNLFLEKYREKIRCIYIDPPFNTGSDAFIYKDNYQHSCWLSMMQDRLALARELLTADGSIYVHIDYNEKERLRLLLDKYFFYITEVIWRIGWVSGYKAKANKYIRNHDTIYYYGKTERPLFNKHYIPYPGGYVRRDGAKPEGEGYPFEDTWNCSELDSLHSIQIMSFSKEKVGCEQLTQKNENLLERMILTSSNQGDLVLDFFAGSGTTCAAAQKMGRKWVGIEMAEYFEVYTLPRMKRVLAGDRYGISEKYNWRGGGFFKYHTLEQYEDTLNNLELPRAQEGQPAFERSGDEYLLRYMLEFETQGSPSPLNLDMFKDPFNYRLKVQGGGVFIEGKADLVETFNYLLGINVKKMQAFTDAGRPYRAVLGEKDGRWVAVVWRPVVELEGAREALLRDKRFIEQTVLPALLPAGKPDRLLVNGPCFVEGAEAIEPEFKRLMFA